MKILLLATLLLFASTAGANAAEGTFTLKSPQFTGGATLAPEQVYNSFGCSGGNISPELVWTDPPAGTKSFAVTMYDPDAPTGSGWWQWVVVNIPADVRSLKLNAGQAGGAKLPDKAVQPLNDYGFSGYGGPCPPPGAAPHHYIFTVYALKEAHLDISATSMPALAGFMIQAAKLGEAKLTGMYGR